ncbi:MAG: hypothetical protein AAGA56_17445 [Myxococcota bacterium]
MAELLACPFCRQLFSDGLDGTEVCPECGVRLAPMAELPPSLEAQALEPIIPVPPEDEVRPWGDPERGRGPLLAVSGVALALLFAPWVRETSPDIYTWSGWTLVDRVRWMAAIPIAWLTLFVLAITRRTVRKMRGARVAVGLLAAIVAMTVAVRIGIPPKAHPLVPVSVEWGFGLWANGALSLLGLWLATRFGGSLDDLTTQHPRDGDEILH